MAISFSTVTFTISAGEYSLADVYTWAQANGHSAKLTQSGSPGSYIYTLTSNYIISISTTGTLTMDEGDTLQWNLTASTYILDIYGEMILTDNCTIIGDTDATSYASIRAYGVFTCLGTSGNEVVIEKYRYIYIYDLYAQVDNIGCTFDHVILRNFVGATTTPVPLYFSYDCNCMKNTHSFTNIEVTGSEAGRFYFYGDMANVIFDNITVDGLYSIVTGAAKFKFSNSSFENIKDYTFGFISQSNSYNYHTGGTSFNTSSKGGLYQPKTTFDNCILGYSPKAYCVHYAYGQLIKFKDCTFKDSRYGIYAYYGTVILLQGNNEFLGFDPVSRARTWVKGTFYWVKSLDLTVLDISGNPIEGAIVFVSQSQGYENHTLISDENGEVLDMYGDNPVFVEKEETSFEVFVDWSDSISGGRYHIVTITKEGYQPWTKNVAFADDDNVSDSTSDITIIAHLQPITGPRNILQ